MKFQPEKIIWSADVSAECIKEAVKSGVLPKGMMIKLDRLGFLSGIPRGMIEMCQEIGYPVFVDAKIIEVPTKVLRIAYLYLQHRPAMLNIMAGACSTGVFDPEWREASHNEVMDQRNDVDLMQRFAQLCKFYGTESCAVTVLTSKTDEMTRREYGTSAMTKVLDYASMMERAGIQNIVCSAEEAKVIKASCKLTINTPGIRLPGTDTRDQARIMTPLKAFAAGADRLVIGSNLTDGEGAFVDRLARNIERLRRHIEEE